MGWNSKESRVGGSSKESEVGWSSKKFACPALNDWSLLPTNTNPKFEFGKFRIANSFLR